MPDIRVQTVHAVIVLTVVEAGVVEEIGPVAEAAVVAEAVAAVEIVVHAAAEAGIVTAKEALQAKRGAALLHLFFFAQALFSFATPSSPLRGTFYISCLTRRDKDHFCRP
jgi:hypothetical protein